MKSQHFIVTGGAGYIGGTLVSFLLNKGNNVHVIDDYSTGKQKIEHPNCNFYCVNITNKINLVSTIDRIAKDHNVAAIYHFAAKISVLESFKNPAIYHNVNVNGTKNLIIAANNAKIKKIVFASSSAIFNPSNNSKFIDETWIQRPINPYGYSKLNAEKLLIKASKENNLQVILLRLFNVSGIADYFMRQFNSGHLIPILCKAIKKNELFFLNGNDYITSDGTCVRDYIHVDDVVNASYLSFLYLCEHHNINFTSFNLGSKLPYSVKQIISSATKLFKKHITVKIKSRRQGTSSYLAANNLKAISELNWKVKHDLKDILISEYNNIK